MLTLLVWVSTCTGILPLSYRQGRVRRILWALPLQGLYLGSALYFIYDLVAESLESPGLYEVIARDFKGEAGNGSAQHLLDWSYIRLIAEFSDKFSCPLGLLLAWDLVDLINLCLQTCSNAKLSNISLYARGSALLVIFGMILPNIVIKVFFTLTNRNYIFLSSSFIRIVMLLPEVVLENYLLLMCLLIGEELAAIRLLVKEATLHREVTFLPNIEDFRSESKHNLLKLLKSLRGHHLDVIDLVTTVNNKFQGYIFICIFGSFLNPTMFWYRLLLEVMSEQRGINIPLTLRMAVPSIIGAVNLFSVWTICKGPQSIQNQQSELNLQLQKILITDSLPKDCMKEVYYMKKQCREGWCEMGIYGMFHLGTEYFFSVLMTICSYITVLKQFNVDGRSFTSPHDYLLLHNSRNINKTYSLKKAE